MITIPTWPELAPGNLYIMIGGDSYYYKYNDTTGYRFCSIEPNSIVDYKDSNGYVMLDLPKHWNTGEFQLHDDQSKIHKLFAEKACKYALLRHAITKITAELGLRVGL